mgnify:CR=1 FL=1
MKLISWNVNGIRAVVKKDFINQVSEMEPDVLCLQETKAQDDQVKEALADLSGYYIYSNSAERKGYSGTAILSKKEPIGVTYDLGVKDHDQEGRVITAEFENFFLVNTYVPNSGQKLVRLDYRGTWDEALRNHLVKLEEKKPVMLCGDLNVAHQPIDIARPDSNYNKSAGYTQQEIDGLTAHLNAGYVDSWRENHPDEVKYSWWSYRMGARKKNIGWRLDYFLVSKALFPEVKETFILSNVMGSDHCPVGLELS